MENTAWELGNARRLFPQLPAHKGGSVPKATGPGNAATPTAESGPCSWDTPVTSPSGRPAQHNQGRDGAPLTTPHTHPRASGGAKAGPAGPAAQDTGLGATGCGPRGLTGARATCPQQRRPRRTLRLQPRELGVVRHVSGAPTWPSLLVPRPAAEVWMWYHQTQHWLRT